MDGWTKPGSGTVKEFFGDIPVGIDSVDFVGRLDQRLDEILREMVLRNLTGNAWDTTEKQIQACYFNAWGEIRSADSFARQVRQMGARYPMLKLRVAKQMHDEMRHYTMYRDCALRMGGKDILETEPVQEFMAMFDYCDQVSDDVRENVFNNQFCTEKWAIFLFKTSMEKLELHHEFKATLERILPDEYFHVSNGREAAMMLAREGEAEQARMIEIATAMMEYNRRAQAGGGQRIVAF
jgi:hypothetical protein